LIRLCHALGGLAARVASGLREELKSESAILMSCTKGIEHGTGMRMSEILSAKFPNNPVSVLSGPNLAVEIARGLPSATVLGCRDETVAEKLQSTLGSSRFRVYTSHEVVGSNSAVLKKHFRHPGWSERWLRLRRQFQGSPRDPLAG